MMAGDTRQVSGGTRITIRAGSVRIAGWLDAGPTAQDFIALLPTTIAMTRWGDREYYGKVLLTPRANEGRRQEGFANGDIGYWVPGGSFALFFDENANPGISDLIVMGTITSDLALLAGLGETADMVIEVDEAAGAAPAD
jgi:hypothetical protein